VTLQRTNSLPRGGFVERLGFLNPWAAERARTAPLAGRAIPGVVRV